MKHFSCSLLFITGIFCFCSCNNTWSQEDKDNYTHTCMEGLNAADEMAGKSKAYCDCMLEKLSTKYPNVNDMMEHMQDVINDKELQQCKDNLK